MKVTQPALQVFQPITITLETQEEAQALYNVAQRNADQRRQPELYELFVRLYERGFRQTGL